MVDLPLSGTKTASFEFVARYDPIPLGFCHVGNRPSALQRRISASIG